MNKEFTYSELLAYLTNISADYASPGPHTLDCRYSKSTQHQQWYESAEFEAISKTQVAADLVNAYRESDLTFEERQRGLQLATTLYIVKSGGPFELVVDKTAMSNEAMGTYLRLIFENPQIDTVNGIPREELQKLYRQREAVDPAQKDILEDRIVESLRKRELVDVAPRRAKPPTEDILSQVEQNIMMRFRKEVQEIAKEREEIDRSTSEILGNTKEAAHIPAKNGSQDILELDRYKQALTKLKALEARENDLVKRVLSKESIQKLISSLGQHGEYIRTVFDSETETVVKNRIKEALAKLQGETKYNRAKNNLGSQRPRL